ncbi:PBP1A family penicillin-binding protein [Bacillus cytotoxicus]|uniref:Penicillin-binding protein 1A n=1 Tax=Bacillus cytotoxicus (strain DSM 22905 / CIP 110041 / 391-98 / NVH 391-98) TaxID=315749 RepID=A7GN86_BACCN|nr:PBP1A family penicillin-binding protein [Bacillus cytotoxicus]ABS21594.1 penicillin-binding protein, 1A family [Bacillus cytotoxicus NVH 391-98]AWC44295.1 penicillin-binding protein [Bacillus cytotoxicus]MDH2862956.1 PBP1A family penicillin-binding protein [Bacillus cytotoxicus]MDH2883115.1 PBP1A family penicillin-binding protein [Bacillus cytotoxicus]NZD31718.1 PBP1A family penicillin-binding protein [Bacillus cytotoxicus]
MSENYRSRTERKHAKQQTKDKNKKDKPKKKGSFFKKFLVTCLLLGIVGLVAGVSAFFVIVKDAPKLDKAKLVNPLSTKFYDKDGNFFYEYGAEKRTAITYDQVPKVVENAFLATEDARFYDHHGIDFKRTGKAIMENITGGFGSQGGSTITQQVIKNYFLTMKKTPKRKVQEWYLAYKLEQKYSKHEILEMYLNKINLGNRSYGVATAAQNYYGKDLKDLKLHEAAMLAGLPQGPNIYDPTKKENVQRATKRRNVVLTLMNRHNFITKQQMEEAMAIPVTEGLLPSKEVTEMPYPAFLDAVVKEVEKQIPDVNIGSDGLQIYTTLDTKAQDYAEKILDGDLIRYPNDKFQGSFVFMDTQTGEVRAVGAGRKESKSTFKGHNLATDLDRQVGSTMKPIFDYGPAIEYMQWSTYHQLNDSEYTYSDGTKIRNATSSYKGDVSMREALKKSLNIPALKTAQAVGLNKSKEFSEKLGMTFKQGPYESAAIGSNESSPLQVAGAYAAFGNDGIYNKPHFVKEVAFPDGKKKNFKPKEERVMKDYTAYMITDMLRDVVKPGSGGTGSAAYVSGVDLAGKTGTQNYDKSVIEKYDIPADANRDSWFAGYTPQYTMAVWTGYENDSSENYIGDRSTKIAQQMFKVMMGKFATDRSRFEQPSSVERINGELYVKGAKKDAIKQIKVDPPTGVTPSYDAGSNTITLSWSGPSDVSYAASYKANDGSSGSLSVKGTSATLGGVKSGVTYSFSVVAQKGTGTSSPAGVSFTVPGQNADAQKKAEEEKRKAEEELKKKAEEEKRKAEEELKKKAEEEKRKAEEELKKKAEEEKRKAEEEAKKQQEQQQNQHPQQTPPEQPTGGNGGTNGESTPQPDGQ